MKEEKKVKEDINYHYINKSLELTKGVPAITLVAWLPTIFVLNIPSVIVSIVLSIIIIFLYRKGYSLIEFVSIIKFVLRGSKLKLFKEEEKYEKKD